MAKGSRGGRQNGASGTAIIPDNITLETRDVLGEKGINHSKELVDIAERYVDADIKERDYLEHALRNLINPNYYSDREYRINCQRCVTALEAQFRGYDVEALGNAGKDDWYGINQLLQFPEKRKARLGELHPDAYDENNYIVANRTSYYGFPSVVYMDSRMGVKGSADKAKRGAEAVTKQIEDRMNSWGIGSRGVLSVKWNDTSSAHTVNIINTKKGPVIMDGQNGEMISGHDKLVKFFKNTTANQTGLVRTDNAVLRSDITSINKVVKKKEK